MACFWFVWNERGTGGIHKNHSWSFDLSFWSRNPFEIGPFSAGCIAPREPCGSSIGSSETLATMPTCSIAIKSMKKPS
jgi:hypothetical protein